MANRFNLSTLVLIYIATIATADWSIESPADMYDNCKTLAPGFNVWWTLDQAAGVLWAAMESNVNANEYMAFGVARDDELEMVGADCTVADFVDGTARARDFYLQDVSPCDQRRKTGVCPDTTFGGTDDIGRVFGSQYRTEHGNVTLIHFSRPIDSGEARLDTPLLVEPGQRQSVVFAIGELDVNAFPIGHRIIPTERTTIEFGRPAARHSCRPLIDRGSLASSLTAKSDSHRDKTDSPVGMDHILSNMSATTSNPSTKSVDEKQPKKGEDEKGLVSNVDPSTAIAATTPRRRQLFEEAISDPLLVLGKSGSHRDKTDSSVGMGHILSNMSTTTTNPSAKSVDEKQPNKGIDEKGLVMNVDPSTAIAATTPRRTQLFEKEAISDPLLVFNIGPSGVDDPSVIYYVNERPTPDIILTRGLSYTFQTMTGNNPLEAMYFHPLVIMTNSSKVLIGPARGRLCLWTSSLRRQDVPVDFALFSKSLSLTCDKGTFDYFTWTPDESTPDRLVYKSDAAAGIGGTITVVNNKE